jgi:hypothetical protein
MAFSHPCYSRSPGSSQHIIFLSIRVINCEKRLDYAAGFSADNVSQEHSLMMRSFPASIRPISCSLFFQSVWDYQSVTYIKKEWLSHDNHNLHC